MIVLGIDGALGAFSAALTRDSNVLATIQVSGQAALEQGLPAVSTVLQQARMTSSRIDRLAVGVGPGTFTGARIAISYAKSLALGWNLPLVGVDSFDIIEEATHLDKSALTVVRGRKGVVSVRYRSMHETWRGSGYVDDVLNALPKGNDIAVLGNAEDVLPGLAERGWHVHQVPRVIEPAALAAALIAARREPARSFHEVRADYGELPAARIPKSL